MQNCRLAEQAATYVKGHFDKFSRKKKKDPGEWCAVSERGYLVVFHLNREEDDKVKLYYSKGLDPFDKIACSCSSTFIPPRQDSEKEYLFYVAPDDDEAINDRVTHAFTVDGKPYSFVLTMSFVLGLKSNEAWPKIKRRLDRLIETIQPDKSARIDLDEAIKALRKLIENGATEHKCRDFIKDYKTLLLPHPYDFRNIEVKTEQVMSNGRSDIIFYARPSHTHKKAKAYIWELKRPLHALLSSSGKSKRYSPSAELVSAENQLLHYYLEFSLNGYLQRKYGIYSEDIKLGGIIIGCDSISSNSPHNSDQAGHVMSPEDMARNIRERYFYEPNNMQLLTWDDVLRRLQNMKESVL